MHGNELRKDNETRKEGLLKCVSLATFEDAFNACDPQVASPPEYAYFQYLTSLHALHCDITRVTKMWFLAQGYRVAHRSCSAYTYTNYLSQHTVLYIIYKMSSGQLFQCQDCDQEFTLNKNFITHVKTVHGNEPRKDNEARKEGHLTCVDSHTCEDTIVGFDHEVPSPAEYACHGDVNFLCCTCT